MRKIAFAKDIHKLFKNKKRKLILGNCEIDNVKWKIKAHSDGDIIIHSLCSSLLSLLNEKTLGELYPENKMNKNINSAIMLNHIINLLNSKNIQVSCIDITVVCEKIILKHYIENIINQLKTFFDYNLSISLKATRFENKHSKYIECYTLVLTE